MTAVVAEGPGESTPDLWADLADTVSRAGEKDDRLWVDDSKLVYKPGAGLGRLEAATRALIAALGRDQPTTFGELLHALQAGTPSDAELSPWINADPAWTPPDHVLNPFANAPWRVVKVRAVVVGPDRFNQGLAESGSKATVHFAAFRTLLEGLWDDTSDATSTRVVSDKHGGRHFYLDKLTETFPDTWIDRGPEGPALSEYTVRQGARRLRLSLRPKADAENGLVALASLVSKTIRELWMNQFNAFWLKQVPDLKPTAGYPVDAARFRRAIEPAAERLGLPPSLWWREK